MRLKIWNLLLLLLLGAVSAETEWWKTSVLYQIYPRSYGDSNGDGSGDIKGIKEHVPYLKDLGIGIVWLSPIYASPLKDAGYDISNFRDVNPLFGTLDDIKDLIKSFHDQGIKFFMDFVPNHSSNEHPWFNASRYSVEPYKDYYVWKDPQAWKGSTPLPPNNWISVFGKGSAWKYDDLRKQFYLHQFGDYQPDLNYSNPKVLDEMFDNMKFWLDMGVDGFRMDAVPFLVEDPQFRNEPVIKDCNQEDCLDHIYTQHTSETYKVLQSLVDRMEKNYSNKKTIFYEAYGPVDKVKKYYYKNTQPFNFQLISNFTMDTNATSLKRIVDEYMKQLPKDAWPNWVVGNHDNSRVGTRLGVDFIDAANMLTLLLPGTSTTFQGEEIGMVDTFIRDSRKMDTEGRDPERTPMQWNQTINAGFSRASNGTWLPVNPNYWYVNVKSEAADTNSHLGIYKKILSLRKDVAESIETSTANISDWVFGFTRTAGKKKHYVVLNLNNVEEKVILTKGFNDMPSKVKVIISTANAIAKEGDQLSANSDIIMRPRSGMVISSSSSILSSLAIIISGLLVIVFRYS